MKRYLPKNAEDASALILTLLVIVLLSTVVTSFLSSTRTEQTATRNYTSKTQAEQFATSATQQAMAKIQQGFTVTGNATTVITTQPGAISQYTFANGNCSVVSGKAPVELFSTNGTTTANLNNLQNPSSNSSATSNQWTITGNASEQINVPLENITSNGTVIGRIAYYVDDEGSKLNLNAAIGNRTTLNVATRPQDIAALISATQSTAFSNIVNNSTSNTSNVTGWSYFFRPEQVSAAVAGFSGNNTPFLSTATSSASTTANMAQLLTPWGTQKIDINTLSTNATDGIGPGNATGDASVRSIFEAFTGLNGTSMNASTTANASAYERTGKGLQNIYNGNFSTKYTALGVKQIAANMLQMRDPNTNSVNASFAYTGPLLGSNNLNAEIPSEYLGYAPYLVISEIGMSACLASGIGGGTSYTYTDPATNATVTVPVNQCDIGLKLQPVIELYNPFPVPFTIPTGAFPRLMVRPSKVTCNMTWSGANGNFNGTFSFPGSKPTGWDYGSPWFGIRTLSDVSQDNAAKYDLLYQANGNSTTIAPYSKIQTRLYLSGSVYEAGYTWIPLKPTPSAPYNGANITIQSISDVKIQFARVILLANSGNNVGNATAGYSNRIRDWVRGDEIGELDVGFDSSKFPYKFIWDGTSLNKDPNFDPPSGANGTAAPVPTKSAQRISHLTKIPNPTTPAISINDANRNWTTTNSSLSTIWLANGASWVSSNSSNFGCLGKNNSTSTDATLAVPSASANYTIPSDPSLGDAVSNAVYAGSNPTDMREPFLLTGNYTCPSDLGFVPTNQRWRRLRMQMQPSAEGSRIPDWAMLDVIAFGNSTNATNPLTRFSPVNLNGRFYLPGNVTNSSPPAPRTIALKALAKVLEISSTGTLQDTMNPTISTTTDATRFKGATVNATTIANNIGNMTWSANSTWGQGSSTNDPGSRRKTKKFPVSQYILPSEIMEIAGVADAVSQTDYNNSASHFKWNEGRASALIPAVTTRSNFFTIYAYAQAGKEINGTFVPDSEHLTKTLLEVEITTPATTTTSAVYKVKSLYTQSIPMGE